MLCITHIDCCRMSVHPMLLTRSTPSKTPFLLVQSLAGDYLNVFQRCVSVCLSVRVRACMCVICRVCVCSALIPHSTAPCARFDTETNHNTIGKGRSHLLMQTNMHMCYARLHAEKRKRTFNRCTYFIPLQISYKALTILDDAGTSDVGTNTIRPALRGLGL
jgi:hypothetical protein